MSAVGSNLPHDSAATHVSGQSTFIDDMLPLRGELLVDFVGSPIAHGVIKSIHVEHARKVPGVVAVFTATDVPGHNTLGPVIADEDLLAKERVMFVGQPVVLIAATTRAALRVARKLVRIEVEPLRPIFSIDDAIAAESFIGTERKIECGDIAAGFARADYTLEGVFEIGGQEHFYLESQAAIAVRVPRP